MKKALLGSTITLLIAATGLTESACGQRTLVERKLADFIEAADAVAEIPDDEDALTRLRATNSTFLDVIGKADHRKAYQTLGALCKKHAGGPFAISDKDAAKLLTQVRALRRQVHPQELVPLLMMLQLGRATDTRIRYTLAEAFGSSSMSTDTKRASRHLQQVLARIRNDDEHGATGIKPLAELIAFLPELGSAAAALEEDRDDTVARFRSHLARCIDRLDQELPIDPWSFGQEGLAQEQLILIWEQLISARQRLEQERCIELLQTMLDIQPHNPVMHMAMAEVQMSLGPAFDRNGAKKSLNNFLALTKPSQLRVSKDRRFRATTEEQVLRDLDRFRLAAPRNDLESQRVAANDYLDMLKSTLKKSEDGLLLAPDGGRIRKQIKSNETKLDTARRTLSNKQRNYEKYDEAAENRRLPANIRGQHRMKANRYLKEVAHYKQIVQQLEQREGALKAALNR